MGLKDDIQVDLKEAFDSDLSDAVQNFVLIHYDRTLSLYDTNTGVNTKSLEEFNSRGIFTNYLESEKFNTHIEPTDMKLVIIQNEINTKPKLRDHIVLDDITYRVIYLTKDPLNATYMLTLRGIES